MMAANSISLRGRVPSGATRGFVALLVLLLVAFFGVLAGLQSLTVISLCGVGRGLEVGLERLLLERQVERAIEESVLQQWERRNERHPAFAEELGAQLAGVAQEGLTLSASTPVAVPDLPADFLEGGVPMAFVPPSASALSRMGPELRRLCGVLVAEEPERTLRLQVGGAAWPGPEGESLKFEYSVLRVPLLALGGLAYDLPDEVGRPVSGTASLSIAGGLASGRDGARRGELVGDGGGLPFYFRRRAGIAAAYARLFSKGFVDAAVRQAGPCLFHRLDLAAAETAQWSGLSRDAEGASLDLALAGGGQFAGRSGTGALLVLASAKPGQVLRLRDSGVSSGEPLVLLVIGAGALRISLGDCRRPVLLIASRVDVVPEGGTWNGALMLGPGCGLLPGSGPVRLPHLSHYAGDNADYDTWFHVEGVPSASLASLSPSVVFANSRVLPDDS